MKLVLLAATVIALSLAACAQPVDDGAAPPPPLARVADAIQPAPIVRPTTLQVDAHDGHIVQDGGRYWLVGTSYGCGFALLDRTSPWCGVRMYSSTDLTGWVDEGVAFDPAGWQQRCSTLSFGCFRPHVAQRWDGSWVMWLNVAADNATSGFAVLTSPGIRGPWTEQPAPQLAVNLQASFAWGDHDITIDSAGTAWLAYTIIGEGNRHDIAIERLDPTWTTGTGDAVIVGLTMVEAPGLFQHDGLWYLTYSDPACPYCGGTGTGYVTAPSPLGPWTPQGLRITDDSCGGQPAAVNELTIDGTPRLLFQSDLWDQLPAGGFNPNQAAARTYLQPLEFDGAAILPLVCASAY